MTKTVRESKTKKKEREKNESNNIPAQCLVLCKLWESCNLAWERASTGLWGNQPAGLQTNTSKVGRADTARCVGVHHTHKITHGLNRGT